MALTQQVVNCLHWIDEASSRAAAFKPGLTALALGAALGGGGIIVGGDGGDFAILAGALVVIVGLIGVIASRTGTVAGDGTRIPAAQDVVADDRTAFLLRTRDAVHLWNERLLQVNRALARQDLALGAGVSQELMEKLGQQRAVIASMVAYADYLAQEGLIGTRAAIPGGHDSVDLALSEQQDRLDEVLAEIEVDLAHPRRRALAARTKHRS